MEDLIYARQSVDKEDSISIESQIELCLREVGNRPHRVFRDKGYSGKNTERPDFQDMMAAVRSGGVSRIIVYRLDRISRSVLDFANVISELQKYGVALQNGVDIKTVSSMLGHYDAGFTLRTYTHATRQAQDDAAEKMGSFIAQMT